MQKLTTMHELTAYLNAANLPMEITKEKLDSSTMLRLFALNLDIFARFE